MGIPPKRRNNTNSRMSTGDGVEGWAQIRCDVTPCHERRIGGHEGSKCKSRWNDEELWLTCECLA